jgi:DNA-dependent RNA polymerase auxiliary subunit epsilon
LKRRLDFERVDAKNQSRPHAPTKTKNFNIEFIKPTKQQQSLEKKQQSISNSKCLAPSL